MIKYLFTLVCVLATLPLLAQRTISVDNNPNSPARYKSLQAAVDSANAGDIIMVHGSGVSYGVVNVTKKLVIIGPGYLLAENPETQANLYSARFDQIVVRDGADGTLLSGLEVTDVMRIDANNVQISRNRIRSMVLNSANNAYISQNFVYEKGIRIENGCGSLYISNNILVGAGQGYASITCASGEMTAMIFNNVLTYGLEVKNATVKNNILVQGELFNSMNNVYQNNVSNKLQFGPTGNNKGNVDMSKVFGGTSKSTDGAYQLAPGSPAAGAGEGVDCGAFGGPTPYILSGIPFVPSISKIDAMPTATAGGGLKVTIKAKTNP